MVEVRRSGAGEEDEEEDDDEGLLELLILVARIPYRLSLSACLLAAASLIISRLSLWLPKIHILEYGCKNFFSCSVFEHFLVFPPYY